MADADVVLLYIGDVIWAERLGQVLEEGGEAGQRYGHRTRFSLGHLEPTTRAEVRGEDGDTYNLLMWVIPKKYVGPTRSEERATS